MNRKSRQISLMVMPPSGRSRTIQLPVWSMFLLGFLVVAFTALIGTSLYLTAKLSADLTAYKQLRQKTSIQEKELLTLNTQLQALNDDIEYFIETEIEIRNLLNKPSSRRSPRQLRREKKKKLSAFKKESKSSQANFSDAQDILPFANHMIATIGKIKTDFNLHYEKIKEYQHRFAATPSIWPVYGYIKSGFGWRRHPVLGTRKFHKGVDIPAWTGAPVKTTADGIVEYAGWSGGYGNTIVMDHSYGYKTIYAHLSQILVKKGDLKKKGETIGQIGSTGLSTGPHLHYEILRWRKSVKTNPYLDLDMFTASSRIW